MNGRAFVPLVLLLVCPSVRAAPAAAVNPRVELLSVLLLLGERPGAAPQEKSPYRRDAERWFAAYSTHPAVARTSDMTALFQLHSSSAPDASVEDFARRSRFADFYAAHREDYRAFAARAESEALTAMHPGAVRAYLGGSPRESPSFVLAPLLPEDASGHLVRLRLRPARYSKKDGYRFLFDQLGSSQAHELVRAALVPLLPDSDARGYQAPPACNDAEGRTRPRCVEEHIILAVLLRALAQDLGEPVYVDLVHAHAQRGFPYLEALGERLREYESGRDRYRALKDFYPRLESVFHETIPDEAGAAPQGAAAELRRLKDLGVKDFVEGRFAAAAEKFAAALKVAPRDAETLLNLGVVYEKLGRKTEALECYDLAVKYSEGRASGPHAVKAAAFSSRANLLRERGRAP